MKTRESFSQTFGLHPIVGFGLFTIDSLLFASELVTFEVTWALTLPIAVILTVVTGLLQKSLYGDTWQAAFGKAAIVGVLTAIPLPLASLTTFLGGMLGTGKALFEKKAENQLLTGK